MYCYTHHIVDQNKTSIHGGGTPRKHMAHIIEWMLLNLKLHFHLYVYVYHIKTNLIIGSVSIHTYMCVPSVWIATGSDSDR